MAFETRVDGLASLAIGRLQGLAVRGGQKYPFTFNNAEKQSGRLVDMTLPIQPIISFELTNRIVSKRPINAGSPNEEGGVGKPIHELVGQGILSIRVDGYLKYSPVIDGGLPEINRELTGINLDSLAQHFKAGIQDKPTKPLVQISRLLTIRTNGFEGTGYDVDCPLLNALNIQRVIVRSVQMQHTSEEEGQRYQIYLMEDTSDLDNLLRADE